MNTYIILRRGAWATVQQLEKAFGILVRVGTREMSDRVRWLRSYIVNEPDGRLGSVCVYLGVDAQALREHAQRAGLPADEVIPVRDTVVIDDSDETASRAPTPPAGRVATEPPPQLFGQISREP